MTKQAQTVASELEVATEQTIKELNDQRKSQELDLQMRFSRMSKEQREAVGNYLNAYNLAAWIYNVLLDEDSRTYIDFAMKFTMETQKLTDAMHDVSGDPQEVQQIVDDINHGE